MPGWATEPGDRIVDCRTMDHLAHGDQELYYSNHLS